MEVSALSLLPSPVSLPPLAGPLGVALAPAVGLDKLGWSQCLYEYLLAVYLNNLSLPLIVPPEPPEKHTQTLVPNNEKEGWCRNKKYISKIAGGFMCTVCRKVYGRYNSVSYHVTIYHRNPPIRCDLSGCSFTTREARYIHFHKYYRHGVELPDTIDLGSRRCPHCKHVSKSPAMLEKHMARHKEIFQCTSCHYCSRDKSLLEEHRQAVHSPSAPS